MELQGQGPKKRLVPNKKTATSDNNLRVTPLPLVDYSAEQDRSGNFIDTISPSPSTAFTKKQVKGSQKQAHDYYNLSSDQFSRAGRGRKAPHNVAEHPQNRQLASQASRLRRKQGESTPVDGYTSLESSRSRGRRKHDVSESTQDMSDLQSLHNRRNFSAKSRKRIRIRSPTPEDPSQAFALHESIPIHHLVTTRNHSRGSLLRRRELGGDLATSVQMMNQLIHENVMKSDLRCWKSWTGASKDVITAAWNPNGRSYAVGSSTDLDGRNMQYNRNNNLLWGDITRNQLIELDDHFIERPRPEATEHGEINNQNMYNALDPRLYTTISSICFSGEGDLMFTGSYDKTVRIWDSTTEDKPPKCREIIGHQERLELLSISNASCTNLLATAQHSAENSVSIYDVGRNNQNGRDSSMLIARTSSERSGRLPLFPTALHWGTIPSQTDHLLVVGFGENRNDEMDRDREGDLLLWDLQREAPLVRLKPSAQFVFDLAWHPTLPVFAAATTPGTSLADRRNTKSVVRTFQPLQHPSRIMEFECPALDINEISFHPRDDHYISAACTDGATYFWDVRMPDTILQKLCHSPAIEELYEDQTREAQDTGVRFTAWDQEGTHFYSGSSDGRIKCWKPFAAPEDVSVREVAAFNSGVMAGSFSPDYSHLLVGLVQGSVQTLSSAPWSHNQDSDDASIRYLPSSHFARPPEHGHEHGEDSASDHDSQYIGIDPHSNTVTGEVTESHMESLQPLGSNMGSEGDSSAYSATIFEAATRSSSDTSQTTTIPSKTSSEGPTQTSNEEPTVVGRRYTTPPPQKTSPPPVMTPEHLAEIVARGRKRPLPWKVVRVPPPPRFLRQRDREKTKREAREAENKGDVVLLDD